MPAYGTQKVDDVPTDRFGKLEYDFDSKANGQGKLFVRQRRQEN